MKKFPWTEAEVHRALDLSGGEEGRVYPHVSTDTRALRQGDLFVALRGERFDAHDFLGQAAEAGATGAVVSRVPANAPAGMRLYRVADTLHALGALARHRRMSLEARVVGVVGSNGKTTTKDLIRAAIGDHFRTHATQGNLNNQVGVPLTLLAAPEDAEVLVVEMGTNEPGEIAILARIARPDAVVITSIGEEHLEKLRDLEGVLEEEVSVLGGLAGGGPALVAEDPDALPERARAAVGPERVRVAGFSARADLRPDGGAEGISFDADGSTRWSWRGHPVRLPLPGRLNVRNALLALGVAVELGVPEAEAVRGLERVPQPKLRGQWLAAGDVRVLADCYNSNPPSLAASVELLASLGAPGRKIAVVGTMRELGDSTDALHRRAAEEIAGRLGNGIDLVVGTGLFAEALAPYAARDADRVVTCADPVEAYDAVAGRLRGNETILLKASRGEALERWIPLLERDFGRAMKKEE